MAPKSSGRVVPISKKSLYQKRREGIVETQINLQVEVGRPCFRVCSRASGSR